jgi:TolB-like protein/DNA-binding winged helix-turn-helix (wHTH) protein/Flp pilus assembly protein TadD
MPRREAAMQDLTSTARLFRFGIFELDARSGELRRHGLKIRLPHQSFEILRILLDRPGEVVTREELRQRLWTSDTFVDFNVGLNSAVRKLREALDDSAENPRFVETLPRRGYRFIASVTPALSDPIPEPEPEPEREPTAGGPETARRVFPSWISGGLVVAAAIATLALAYESRWWERIHTGTAAGHIRSLAVLPFENLSGDPAQDYFVDGMTDALTTDLAQVGGLDVISRTSAMQYRDAKKLVPVIGRELNVDALLEGTVIRSGQDVRITAQLVHAATDRHVWAERYEGKLRDVAALQQKIARAVVGAIQGRLAPLRGRSAQPIAVDPEAYDAYLKGLTAPGRGSYEGFRTAVAYFEEAVARQPDFAVAYAALAQAQHQFLFGGPLSPRETMPKAEAAARKAVELDETLAQAHQTLGGILQHFHWKWEEGDKEFARARELSPQFMEPAGIEALIRNGRFEEAITLSERARTRDPISFNAYLSVGSSYRAAGQYDRAIAEIRRAIEINPRQMRAYFQLGATFIFMGRLNEAIKELETAVRSTPGGNPRFQAYLGYAYAAGGRPLDARRILSELEARARQQYVSSFGVALIHDVLGEKEAALAAFERAYQDRAVEFAQMTQYPPFKTIASEPRFQTLMREIGLPR